MVNTAIESVVDQVSGEYHPLAKIAKDTAAAAVLLTALHAIIIGLLVFHDKIWPLRIRSMSAFGIEWYLVALGPVVLLYFILQTIIRRKRGSAPNRAIEKRGVAPDARK